MERREAVRKVVRKCVEIRANCDMKVVGWETGERVREVPKRMPVIRVGRRVVIFDGSAIDSSGRVGSESDIVCYGV